jgi:hypothetical protein
VTPARAARAREDSAEGLAHDLERLAGILRRTEGTEGWRYEIRACEQSAVLLRSLAALCVGHARI